MQSPTLTQVDGQWLLQWGQLRRTFTEAELDQILSPEDRAYLAGSADAESELGVGVLMRLILGNKVELVR